MVEGAAVKETSFEARLSEIMENSVFLNQIVIMESMASCKKNLARSTHYRMLRQSRAAQDRPIDPFMGRKSHERSPRGEKHDKALDNQLHSSSPQCARRSLQRVIFAG